MLSEDRVSVITHRLLHITAEQFPDITVPEMLSAVFTIAKSLIHVCLEDQNDEHNRGEILRCLGSLEQDVWMKIPKEKIN